MDRKLNADAARMRIAGVMALIYALAQFTLFGQSLPKFIYCDFPLNELVRFDGFSPNLHRLLDGFTLLDFFSLLGHPRRFRFLNYGFFALATCYNFAEPAVDLFDYLRQPLNGGQPCKSGRMY